MANPYINVYMNNPTAGQTNGTQVSLDGAQTTPISVTLDAGVAEHKIVKLAVRCETGYTTTGNTTITAHDINPDDAINNTSKWTFAADNNYANAEAAEAATFSSSLTIGTPIGTTNTVFWAKATSDTTEAPGRDTTVALQVSATITAAD